MNMCVNVVRRTIFLLKLLNHLALFAPLQAVLQLCDVVFG
jgi:hypothetical protein